MLSPSVKTWMRRADVAVRSALIQVGDEPPSEFKLFGYGVNDSSKGPVTFDEQSAKSVMAAYRRQGTDLLIDLEHLSLENPEKSINYDPDARGWCKLELREDGLYAVAVSWTPDGEARLREKKQRYISPAFYTTEDGRVTEMLNIALTGMPATYRAAPLVAASRRMHSSGVSLDDARRMVTAALSERLFPNEAGDLCVALYVVDMFAASAVYEHEGKLFEVPYTLTNGSAQLGAPTEVQRTYTPVVARQQSTLRRALNQIAQHNMGARARRKSANGSETHR